MTRRFAVFEVPEVTIAKNARWNEVPWLVAAGWEIMLPAQPIAHHRHGCWVYWPEHGLIGQ